MSSGTALLHLVFIALMLVLLAGGTVGLLILWYMRGRDPHVGKSAEYVEFPPDDLPPGAAGTLIDEHADHNDVVATLLGLGRHGAVTIQEIGQSEQLQKQGRSVAHDYEITVVDPNGVESKVERSLLKVLFPGDIAPGTSTLLSDVKQRFTAAEADIRDALYLEMVDRDYFKVSPATTRMRWRRGAWIGLVLSVIVGLFLTIRVDPFAALATIASVILFIALIRMSRVMPQKTSIGAEAAQNWRAFKRYLQSIDKYKNLKESSDLFDRYFSYAVAFGLQKQWVTAFARAGARNPAWFSPSGNFGGGRGNAGDIGDVLIDSMWMGHMAGHIGGGSSDLGGGIDLPNVNMPNIGMPDLGNVDMQGMSDVFGGGIQGASDGLSGLLESAGSIFDAIDFDIFN
jgi:hypothetical protein